MSEQKRTYLGDGLYAMDDGFMFHLLAPREEGHECWVALEPEVLTEFLNYVAKQRGLSITVKKANGHAWESGT